MACLALLLTGAVFAAPAMAEQATLGVAVPVTSSSGLGCNLGTCTLAQTGLSGGLVATPAPGRITAWWAVSSNAGSTATLRVFHRVQPVFQQRYEAVGTSSSEALQSTVIAFPADLPVNANNVLGLTFPTGSSVDAASNASSNVELFSDDFPDGTAEVATNQFADTLEFGARFTFEPVVSGIAASSGATSGGETVVITGDHLTDSTKVMFGATPAMSFSIDSNTRITATTPPESAGAVDVTVAGPGGTSATSAADQYTFGTPAATVSPTNLAFGDQPVGSSSAVLAVTLTNTGDVPVTVDADTLGGADAQDFTKSSDGCSRHAVATGGSCSINLISPRRRRGRAARRLRSTTTHRMDPTTS